MWSVNLISGSIVLFFGLIVRIFNASGLIAGYNTSSKEKKDTIDERKLTRFVGDMLIIASINLLIGGLLSIITNIDIYLITISWIIFLIIILYIIIYTDLGNHFKK